MLEILISINTFSSSGTITLWLHHQWVAANYRLSVLKTRKSIPCFPIRFFMRGSHQAAGTDSNGLKKDENTAGPRSILWEGSLVIVQSVKRVNGSIPRTGYHSIILATICHENGNAWLYDNQTFFYSLKILTVARWWWDQRKLFNYHQHLYNSTGWFGFSFCYCRIGGIPEEWKNREFVSQSAFIQS